MSWDKKSEITDSNLQKKVPILMEIKETSKRTYDN